MKYKAFLFFLTIVLTFIFLKDVKQGSFLFLHDEDLFLSKNESLSAFYVQNPLDLGSPNSSIMLATFWSRLFYTFVYSVGLNLNQAQVVIYFLKILIALFLPYIGFKKLSTLYLKDSNDLILHEKEMLIHIQKNLNPLSFPVYLDHFKFSDDSLANVTKYIEGFDFCTLQNFYTEGISVSNAVWILERILSACGNLHSKLIIHGLIEPSNLIVTHYNHNVTIIDFCGAIQDANSNDAKYSLLNDFSAPEITKDLSPHPRTDLFSIGKSMIYLLSGNNENNYQKNIKDYPDFDSLIQKMVESNPKKRSDDCFQEWEKLEKIRTKYFGPDRFRDFLDKVPGKGI